MAGGMLLSAVCSTETAAVQGAIAIYYPTLFLSGKSASADVAAGAICGAFFYFYCGQA